MASGVMRIYGVHVSASPAVPPAAVPGVEGGDAAAAPSTPICSCDLYVTSEVDVGGGPEAPATRPGPAPLRRCHPIHSFPGPATATTAT